MPYIRVRTIRSSAQTQVGCVVGQLEAKLEDHCLVVLQSLFQQATHNFRGTHIALHTKTERRPQLLFCVYTRACDPLCHCSQVGSTLAYRFML